MEAENVPEGSSLAHIRNEAILREGWDENGERYVTFTFKNLDDGGCVPLYDGLALLEMAKLNLISRYKDPGHDGGPEE